ncbi:hypothetical protein Tco_0772189 [Tanacetum coccineum]|uniref:Uncharacterized protein n=1 Tax=Tanacetum coccineum TaxID=301880 RepID=A0ABQ4ZKY7_9ASTR
MAAPGPSNQLARRAIDELMEFTGETQIVLQRRFAFGIRIGIAANWICSEIMEYKWALFYCLPNISLEQGLKLIHTDNDVHSFFADTERSGKIHLYITHKKWDLGRYYLRNTVWVEEDVALRCSSSSPFSTRIKRKGGKTTKEDLRKKAKEKKKMVDDKPVGRKSVQTSRKGKEIMYEFPGPSPTKENQQQRFRDQLRRTNELPGNYCVFEVNYDGVFNEYPLRCSLEEGLTILEGDGDMNKLYDIAEEKLDTCSMSPYELVEWEQQEVGSPYLRIPPLKLRRKGIEFPCKNLFRDFLHCDNVANKLVLDDNWQYEGLAVEDVGGSSKHCDLVHENVVYNGHSLPNMDKERFSNNVVLDDVVTDNLAYTLSLVLKKKCRNKVNVTRKTRCLNNSKSMRLRKGCGKRVAIGGHGRGLGRLIGLNVDAVDDDPQCIPDAGDTYLLYNLSCVLAHTSRTADRHQYLPPVVTLIMPDSHRKGTLQAETDIQEKEQKESQSQTNPSTEWKGQSQKSSK